MGSFHLFQAVIMIFLAIFITKIADYTPFITTSYLAFDPISQTLVPITKNLFEFPFGIMTAMFLVVSGVFHYIVSLPKKVNDFYNRGLENNINIFR